MKSEYWVCTECEFVTLHPGSRRWPAAGDAFHPVTLWCPHDKRETKHWREPEWRTAKARESRRSVAQTPVPE
jgi:hypothetical protein